MIPEIKTITDIICQHDLTDTPTCLHFIYLEIIVQLGLKQNKIPN